jgi:predicted flavoprotein YhiN
MPRVVVIGAGAAGTMAAIFAARSGARTTLVERTADGGRKILISGGGRCNILPSRLDEARFVTDSSPNTLRKILRSWPLGEQIAFFNNEVGIPLKEEPESAKLFPVSERARDVRDGLLALAKRSGVELLMNTIVTDVGSRGAGRRSQIADREGQGEESGLGAEERGWTIARSGAAPIEADAVIIATGGLSVPNTGSDGTGLEIVEKLRHRINPTYAALTPLVAQPAPFASLSGVSLPVTITARTPDDALEATATGGFLFTHVGYSGPAVLDISHVAVRSRERAPARVTVQWSPLDERQWTEALKPAGSRTVLAALRAELPQRLAVALHEAAGLDLNLKLAELTRPARLRLIETLVRGVLPWTGDEGYKKAEVTGGGVDLAEIDARTMESRRCPGLFLCGELLDAFGPIGGYNFYWAWATGRAAGLGASLL